MASGLAVEFALASDSEPLDVEAAIDYVRTAVAADMNRSREWQSNVRDSHRNVVVEASAAGFTTEATAPSYDHGLFGLFSLLVHGGGFPWFEDVYTFAGFMLRGERCRIYIRVTDNGTVYGIEIPLTHADGRPLRRFAGSLPQELASLVPDGDLATNPVIDDRDDYCGQVFDLTSRIIPAAPSA
ncbi:hypothetical protein HC031_22880 [Planosporangium thailandense]|uniref:Uncharacterized protein n=2 Tax=Planosporangium thailandense TaxID=765197 RepID=A0ABX0Y2G7_9ACTN|nr:hypothetical protein [Planosporangium thailandense]